MTMSEKFKFNIVYKDKSSIPTPKRRPAIAPMVRLGTNRPHGTLIPKVTTNIAR